MPVPPQFEGKTFRERPEDAKLGGRPKGSRSRSTIVREALEAILAGTEQTVVDAITAAAIKQALEGNVTAWEKLMDSGYGKVTDKLETTGADGAPIENNLTVKFVE
jgi:hypothetical protein